MENIWIFLLKVISTVISSTKPISFSIDFIIHFDIDRHDSWVMVAMSYISHFSQDRISLKISFSFSCLSWAQLLVAFIVFVGRRNFSFKKRFYQWIYSPLREREYFTEYFPWKLLLLFRLIALPKRIYALRKISWLTLRMFIIPLLQENSDN